LRRKSSWISWGGGWDTCEPIGRDFAFDAGELTDEQRQALEHILASTDLVMDVSGIAGAGKSHLLEKVERAAVSMNKSVAVLSPTDASVKDLRRAGFQARTFQGFQLRPERADVLVIDEASMLSVPQMQSGAVRYVKSLQTQRQKVPALVRSSSRKGVSEGRTNPEKAVTEKA
jgi:chromosomal replication initiation ATPase DnaA